MQGRIKSGGGGGGVPNLGSGPGATQTAGWVQGPRPGGVGGGGGGGSGRQEKLAFER